MTQLHGGQVLLGFSAMRTPLPYKDFQRPAWSLGVILRSVCITGEPRGTCQQDGNKRKAPCCRDNAPA